MSAILILTTYALSNILFKFTIFPLLTLGLTLTCHAIDISRHNRRTLSLITNLYLLNTHRKHLPSRTKWNIKHYKTVKTT